MGRLSIHAVIKSDAGSEIRAVTIQLETYATWRMNTQTLVVYLTVQAQVRPVIGQVITVAVITLNWSPAVAGKTPGLIAEEA